MRNVAIDISRHDADGPPAGLELLAAAAEAAGFRHVRRLLEECANGSFSAEGGLLLIAVRDGILVGVGAFTSDPFVAGSLRMRRFYVRPDQRGLGIGGELARRLLAAAAQRTKLVTVNAGGPAAACFWEHVGFRPVTAAHHTHELAIGPAPADEPASSTTAPR